MNQTTHPSFDLNADALGQLLRLFHDKSAVLRFPDVDADSLSQAMVVVEAQREKVDEILEALGDARDELGQLEEALMRSAQKAHAYATVFSAGDQELEAQLNKIEFVAPGRTGRKKRPGTKKAVKGRAQSASPNPAVEESDTGVPDAGVPAKDVSIKGVPVKGVSVKGDSVKGDQAGVLEEIETDVVAAE